MTKGKRIHIIILDAGPLLKNDPAIDTLIASSERLFTVPSVISEIRDRHARSRVETMLKAFIVLRDPRPQSLQFVIDFAKKSGDFAALSRTDLQLLALTYELECERNEGDWRLRSVPGQKVQNGACSHDPKAVQDEHSENTVLPEKLASEGSLVLDCTDLAATQSPNAMFRNEQGSVNPKNISQASSDSIPLEKLIIGDRDAILDPPEDHQQQSEDATRDHPSEELSETSDSEGWITPSNIKKHQTRELNASTTPESHDSVMQVACMTTDFAMQNVLLQIGLNLLSPSLQRIRNIRTYILRCHACFQRVKDTSKQFCPRCGKPTLTRVSCSTNQKGEFRIHLKKNMQWNNKGNRYSIPKPVSGSANGKVREGKGGGKGGWGQGLILAEDQKEYQRAVNGNAGLKPKDLMDEEYLPSILTGDRGRVGSRLKIGAGRNINARKRVK